MAREVISGLEAEMFVIQRKPDGSLSKTGVAFLRDFNFNRNNESYTRRDVGRSFALSHYKGTNTVGGSFTTDSDLSLSPFLNSFTANYIMNGDADLKIGTQAVLWNQSSGVTVTSSVGFDEDTQTWVATGKSWHLVDSASDGYEELSQTFNVPFALPSIADAGFYDDAVFKSLYFRFAFQHVSGVTTVKLTGVNTKTGAVITLNSIALEGAESSTFTLPVNLSTISSNFVEQVTVTVTSQYDNTGVEDLTNTANTYVTHLSMGETPSMRFVNRRKTLNLEDMAFIIYETVCSDGSPATFLFVGVEFTSWGITDPQDINSEAFTFKAMDLILLDPDSAAYGFFRYGDDAYYGEATLGGV